MTSQNIDGKYSSLLSDTEPEASSLDGLDQSKSLSRPKHKEIKFRSMFLDGFQFKEPLLA